MAGTIPLGDGRSVRFDGEPPIWAWHDEFMGFQVMVTGDGLVWSGDDLRGRTFTTTQAIPQYFALGPNASDLPDLIQEDLTRWLKARYPEHADAPDLVWRWRYDGSPMSVALVGDGLVWMERDATNGGGLAQSFVTFFDDGPLLPGTLPGIVLRIADALKRRDPVFLDRATPFEAPTSRLPAGRRRYRPWAVGAVLLGCAVAVYLVLRGWG